MNYIDKIIGIAHLGKYTKWYCSIISKAQSRAKTRKAAKKLLGYTERHHILPKSFKLGGEKDKMNYAYLSADEHFLCHLLLTKMFDGEFKIKMCFALHSMRRILGRNGKLKLTSWEYKKLKEANAYARSKSSSGMKGKKHRPDSIEKMRENAYMGLLGKPAWNRGKKEAVEKKKKRMESLKKYREGHPEWKEQLRDASRIGEPNRLLAIQKRTQVDGRIYESATKAAAALGLKKITLIKRVLSKNFPEYKYIEE
jgi:hypothetical protein